MLKIENTGVLVYMVVLLMDAAQMLKAYRKRDTAGVLFWGVLFLAVSISMT